MQKFTSMLFPALALCFLLVFGAWSLGRRGENRVTLRVERSAPVSDQAEAESRSPSPALSAERIELNRATLEELITLPGIGPERAQKILDYREAQGPFQYTTDLLNVKGIGEALYDKLRDLVYVEESDENTDH